MPTKTTQNYEALVILNPMLGEEETNALVERLAGVLTGGGANLRETARWGKRKLAYEIEKKNEGYYVIYYFTTEGPAGAFLGQFARTCRYDEQVMRQMIVNVPTTRRGQEVAQLVPSPGWLAEFKLEPRAHSFRRRAEYDRGGSAPAPAAPAAPVVAEEVVAEETAEKPVEAPVQAPAQEPAQEPPQA